MKKQSAPLDLDDLFGTSTTTPSTAAGQQATQTGAGGGGTQDILDLFGTAAPAPIPTAATGNGAQGASAGAVNFDLFDAFNTGGAPPPPPQQTGSFGAAIGAPTGAAVGVDLFSGLSVAPQPVASVPGVAPQEIAATPPAATATATATATTTVTDTNPFMSLGTGTAPVAPSSPTNPFASFATPTAAASSTPQQEQPQQPQQAAWDPFAAGADITLAVSPAAVTAAAAPPPPAPAQPQQTAAAISVDKPASVPAMPPVMAAADVAQAPVASVEAFRSVHLPPASASIRGTSMSPQTAAIPGGMSTGVAKLDPKPQQPAPRATLNSSMFSASPPPVPSTMGAGGSVNAPVPSTRVDSDGGELPLLWKTQFFIDSFLRDYIDDGATRASVDGGDDTDVTAAAAAAAVAAVEKVSSKKEKRVCSDGDIVEEFDASLKTFGVVLESLVPKCTPLMSGSRGGGGAVSSLSRVRHAIADSRKLLKRMGNAFIEKNDGVLARTLTGGGSTAAGSSNSNFLMVLSELVEDVANMKPDELMMVPCGYRKSNTAASTSDLVMTMLILHRYGEGNPHASSNAFEVGFVNAGANDPVAISRCVSSFCITNAQMCTATVNVW